MGVAGIVVAAILSLSAFAIAGGSIDEPARPVSIHSGRETPKSSEPSRTETATSSPEPDDHGGASQEPSTQPFTATPSEGAGVESSSSEPATNDHDEDD
jgi:hypothetical protein